MHCGFTYRTVCSEKVTLTIFQSNKKRDEKLEIIDRRKLDGQMHLALYKGQGFIFKFNCKELYVLWSLMTAPGYLKELCYCNHFKFGTQFFCVKIQTIRIFCLEFQLYKSWFVNDWSSTILPLQFTFLIEWIQSALTQTLVCVTDYCVSVSVIFSKTFLRTDRYVAHTEEESL